MRELLAPGRFIDSNARSIVELAHSVTAGLRDDIDGILRLYRTVRDSIVYDPYVDVFDQQTYRQQRSGRVAVSASVSRRCLPPRPETAGI